MTTRAEHLKWCKDRALEYADAGETGNAISSLIQDFGLHEDTAGLIPVVSELMFPLALTGEFDHPGRLRKFIEGFAG